MHHFDDEHHDRMHRAQHRAWRKMEAMGRRFGGGPGPGWGGPRGAGFGDWGGFGDSFRIGKMIASGDLRLIALYFIEQQPRHGYDLIRAIEELTHGSYAPSPGVVYPTLTMLEDMGLIEEAPSKASRKPYQATAEGRAHLEENAEEVEALFERLQELAPKESHSAGPAIGRAVKNLMTALSHRVGRDGLNDDLLHEIAAILDEAAQKIERLK